MKLTVIVMAGGTPRLADTCMESLHSVHKGDDAALYVADGDKGCAFPRNDGVRNGPEADIYLTLDSDVIFTRPVLDIIRERFEADPSLGVLGARLYHASGTIQHAGAWVHHREAGHYGNGLTDAQYPISGMPYYCDYVCGAVFAFRKKTWEDVGGFDESNMFGPEDSNFCFKAWEKGWKVLYDPAMTAVHVAGGVRGSNSAPIAPLKREALNIRNYEGIEAFRRNYWKWDFNPIFRKVHEANSKLYPETNNIVRVCRWDALGDCLASTAAIRELKREHPEKQVHVISNNPEVFTNNPDIASVSQTIVSPFGLKIELNSAIEREPSKNLYRILDEQINGKDGVAIRPRLYSDRADVDQYVAKMRQTFGTAYPKKIAVMHCPRTHWKSKELSALFWQKVAHGMAEKGFHVLCVGTDTDFLPKHAFVSDFRGSTSGVLKEIIKNADVFIGVDSFPMHVCLTTDTQGVVLFTGTDPELILPKGQNIITPIVANVVCRGCKALQPAPVCHLECPQNREYACTEAFYDDEIVKIACGVAK